MHRIQICFDGFEKILVSKIKGVQFSLEWEQKETCFTQGWKSVLQKFSAFQPLNMPVIENMFQYNKVDEIQGDKGKEKIIGDNQELGQ